MTIHNTEAIF